MRCFIPTGSMGGSACSTRRSRPCGRAALEALPHQNVWFVPAAHGWLAQILVERGAAGEAAGLLDAAEATVAPDAFSRAPRLRARTMVEAARGPHQSALAHALELGHQLAAF